MAALLAEHELPLTELRAGHRSLEEIYLRVAGSSADGTARPDEDPPSAPRSAAGRGAGREDIGVPGPGHGCDDWRRSRGPRCR